MKSKSPLNLNRRQFLVRAALTSGGIIATNVFSKSFAQAPGIITSDKMRPSIPYGVASGDINGQERGHLESQRCLATSRSASTHCPNDCKICYK